MNRPGSKIYRAYSSTFGIALLTILVLGTGFAEAQVPMSTDAGKRELQRQKETDQNFAADMEKASNWDERAWVYFTFSNPDGEIQVSGGNAEDLTVKAKKETITAFPATIPSSVKQVNLQFTLQDGKKKRKIKVKCDLPTEPGVHETGVFLMPGTQRYNCLSRPVSDS